MQTLQARLNGDCWVLFGLVGWLGYTFKVGFDFRFVEIASAKLLLAAS